MSYILNCFFFFSSRRRHTRFDCDWSSDVCSSDLLVARGVAAEFLPQIGAIYAAKGVEMRGCPESLAILKSVAGAQLAEATEQDWSEEYLAPIISVKIVAGVDEAIAHIKIGRAHV